MPATMTRPQSSFLPPVRNASGDLARNLVAARSAAGLTQQMLAKRSGISRATIAQIEAGDSDPRQSTIAFLAAALGVSPIALILSPREAAALAHVDVEPAAGNADDPSARDIGAAIGRSIQAGRFTTAVATFIAAAAGQHAEPVDRR